MNETTNIRTIFSYSLDLHFHKEKNEKLLEMNLLLLFNNDSFWVTFKLSKHTPLISLIYWVELG